jgi:peptide/nickel transport system substrate-binding protein
MIGRMLRLAAVACCGVLAASCGGNGGGGGGGGTPARTSDGKTTLTIAIPGEIETLDPCCANFIRSHHALYSVYEVPVIHPKGSTENGVTLTDTTKLEGLSFESWDRVDPTTYRIKIREGLTFHNGKPITAHEIRYMFERTLNTDGGGNWLLQNIAFVSKPPKVIDDHTLELKTDKPSQLAMQALYMTSSAAIDPEVVKEHATKDDPWATKWMSRNVAGGSGPYKLTEHVPDQEVVFEAWPEYWRGKPPIDRIVWKIVPSPAERVTLLRSGAVDMAEGLGTEEFNALKDADGVKVINAPSDNMVTIGMHNGREPFDDVKVRQAVSYAINYDDILQNVYRGEASRLWGPLPAPSEYALGDAAGYDRDVERAKQLLAESGYDGEPVKLSIDSAKAGHQLIAVRVQSALREVGMNVEIEQLTSPVFAERKAGKELQMIFDEMLAWIDDPDYTLSLILQCDVFGNYVDYCNKEVDRIIADGWAESDAAKRKEMFDRAQRLIIEDAPLAFLAQPDFRVAMRDDVGGYVHYLNEIPRYYDFSFTQ